MTLPGWWSTAESRLSQLSDAKREARQDLRHVRWRLLDAAATESAALRDLALPLLVRGSADRWRCDASAPSWRLPPDGWVKLDLADTHPVLDFCSGPLHTAGSTGLATEISDWATFIDFLVRADAERRDPTPPPFQPVTERRVRRDRDVEALLDQEQRNLGVFRRHAELLHRHKHDGGVHLDSLFADPELDSALPVDLVVYHQLGSSRFGIRPGLRDAVLRHLDLPVGAIVHYAHARSATTKVWWFGSLSGNPRWLNTVDDGQPETDFRLELAPRRGAYVGEATKDIARTHLGGEEEVVLPAGTTWRVVGHRDVVQSNSRLTGTRTSERLHAIQMVEIDPATLPAGTPVLAMST